MLFFLRRQRAMGVDHAAGRYCQSVAGVLARFARAWCARRNLAHSHGINHGMDKATLVAFFTADELAAGVERSTGRRSATMICRYHGGMRG